jgi:hypothetical protein
VRGVHRPTNTQIQIGCSRGTLAGRGEERIEDPEIHLTGNCQIKSALFCEWNASCDLELACLCGSESGLDASAVLGKFAFSS